MKRVCVWPALPSVLLGPVTQFLDVSDAIVNVGLVCWSWARAKLYVSMLRLRQRKPQISLDLFWQRAAPRIALSQLQVLEFEVQVPCDPWLQSLQPQPDLEAFCRILSHLHTVRVDFDFDSFLTSEEWHFSAEEYTQLPVLVISPNLRLWKFLSALPDLKTLTLCTLRDDYIEHCLRVPERVVVNPGLVCLKLQGFHLDDDALNLFVSESLQTLDLHCDVKEAKVQTTALNITSVCQYLPELKHIVWGLRPEYGCEIILPQRHLVSLALDIGCLREIACGWNYFTEFGSQLEKLQLWYDPGPETLSSLANAAPRLNELEICLDDIQSWIAVSTIVQLRHLRVLENSPDCSREDLLPVRNLTNLVSLHVESVELLALYSVIVDPHLPNLSFLSVGERFQLETLFDNHSSLARIETRLGGIARPN